MKWTLLFSTSFAASALAMSCARKLLKTKKRGNFSKRKDLINQITERKRERNLVMGRLGLASTGRAGTRLPMSPRARRFLPSAAAAFFFWALLLFSPTPPTASPSIVEKKKKKEQKGVNKSAEKLHWSKVQGHLSTLHQWFREERNKEIKERSKKNYTTP